MAVGVRVEHGNVQQLRVCVPGWLIQGGNDRKGCRGEGKWGLEDWVCVLVMGESRPENGR